MTNQSIFSVRPVGVKDASEICLLADQLGYPDTLDAVKTRLEIILTNPNQAVFVIEMNGGKVVGYVHVVRQVYVEAGTLVELGGLVIHANFRHMGLGKLLIAEAEKWTHEKGCHTIRLRSNIIRSEAHNFYRNLGFEITKTQHTFIKTLGKR